MTKTECKCKYIIIIQSAIIPIFSKINGYGFCVCVVACTETICIFKGFVS